MYTSLINNREEFLLYMKGERLEFSGPYGDELSLYEEILRPVRLTIYDGCSQYKKMMNEDGIPITKDELADWVDCMAKSHYHQRYDSLQRKWVKYYGFNSYKIHDIGYIPHFMYKTALEHERKFYQDAKLGIPIRTPSVYRGKYIYANSSDNNIISNSNIYRYPCFIKTYRKDILFYSGRDTLVHYPSTSSIISNDYLGRLPASTVFSFMTNPSNPDDVAFYVNDFYVNDCQRARLSYISGWHNYISEIKNMCREYDIRVIEPRDLFDMGVHNRDIIRMPRVEVRDIKETEEITREFNQYLIRSDDDNPMICQYS